SLAIAIILCLFGHLFAINWDNLGGIWGRVVRTFQNGTDIHRVSLEIYDFFHCIFMFSVV
ncbi:MAG: hypothetical protein RRY64_08265, partial [Oscillospiraceae bacterium]